MPSFEDLNKHYEKELLEQKQLSKDTIHETFQAQLQWMAQKHPETAEIADFPLYQKVQSDGFDPKIIPVRQVAQITEQGIHSPMLLNQKTFVAHVVKHQKRAVIDGSLINKRPIEQKELQDAIQNGSLQLESQKLKLAAKDQTLSYIAYLNTARVIRETVVQSYEQNGIRLKAQDRRSLKEQIAAIHQRATSDKEKNKLSIYLQHTPEAIEKRLLIGNQGGHGNATSEALE